MNKGGKRIGKSVKRHMKMKKKANGLLAGVLCVGLLLGGCGSTKTDSKASSYTKMKEAVSVPVQEAASETSSVSPVPAQDPDEGLKVIGTKAEGKDIYKVRLTNGTGKKITGISISYTANTSPANMITDGSAIETNETFLLYYDGEQAASVNANTQDGATVVLTFEDQSTASYDHFPFADIDEAQLLYGDDVYYLEYTSKTDGSHVSTKNSAIQKKQEAEAAAKAKAESEAAEKAASEKAAAEAAARAQSEKAAAEQEAKEEEEREAVRQAAEQEATEQTEVSRNNETSGNNEETDGSDQNEDNENEEGNTDNGTDGDNGSPENDCLGDDALTW